jgi:DNA-binding transcriptional LysR family regulator
VSRQALLNYHHAELLFHVLRARTLTDAAQALHISQPAITKQLKALEEDLGVKLFKKEGRTLNPTAEALLLAGEIERARASLTSLNELAVRLRAGVAGKLTVCVYPALAQALLPEVITEFRGAFPAIHLEVKIENSWRILDLAEAQLIDVGVCYPFRELRQVSHFPLLDSRIVCVVKEGDDLASGGDRMLADLKGRPIVTVEVFDSNPKIRSAMYASQLDREISCVVSNSSLACDLVLRSGGVAIVDSLTAASYAARGLATVGLVDMPTRSITLLRPNLRPSSMFADEFSRCLRLAASGCNA